MSTEEISQSIKDCDHENFSTDNGTSGQRNDSLHSFQGSIEPNQITNHSDHKINSGSLAENSDSNFVSQDLNNVNKHADSKTSNENVNSDIKEVVNSVDNVSRQSNSDLRSVSPSCEGLPNKSEIQNSNTHYTNSKDCLNAQLDQKQCTGSSENIQKADDVKSVESTVNNSDDKQRGNIKEDTSESCTASETNLNEEEPETIAEDKSDGQNAHISVEKADDNETILKDSEQKVEEKPENEEQGDNYEDDFEETHDDKQSEEHAQKENEQHNDEVVKPTTESESANKEENSFEQQGDNYEDDFEDINGDENKTSEQRGENKIHSEENLSTVNTPDTEKVEVSQLNIETSSKSDDTENSSNIKNNEEQIPDSHTAEVSLESTAHESESKDLSDNKQSDKKEIPDSHTAEVSLESTAHESESKDLSDNKQSDNKETDQVKCENIDAGKTVIDEPGECVDSNTQEDVQKRTAEISINKAEEEKYVLGDTVSKENTEIVESIADNESKTVASEQETSSVKNETKPDKKTDKDNSDDSEDILTSNALGDKEKTVSNSQDIDQENTLTKIVVDEEGLPKVAVTTVPDRPPSSQASDIENIEDPFDDFDTFTDDPPKTASDIVDIPSMEGNKDTEQQKVTEYDTDTPEVLADNKSNSKSIEPNKQPETETITNEEEVEFNKQKSNIDEGQAINLEEEKQHIDIPNSGDEKDDGTIKNGPNTPEQIETNQQESNEYVEKNEEEKNKKADDPKPDKNPVEKPKSPEPVVQKESPLEQLLKRNVEIDGTIDSVTSLESNVTLLLGSMKDVMMHYSDLLKLQPLKDFTNDLGKFRGDFTTINDAFKQCTALQMNMNQQLKELRHVTEDVRSQIHRKFQQEDLSTWVDITPDEEKEKERLQEETYAAEKAAMAKAAEARHAVAVATAGVSESQQLIAQMETQVAEAEAVSCKAAAQARTALVVAEEARKAAEERRIAEEASKKRAEERARIKAAEEEKKKAEEEMKIYQESARKGTSVEDERERFMEEKRRKEEERKNPKNWPRYSYSLTGVDFNPSIGCIIRAIDGSMRKTDVTCECVDQSNGILTLKDNEELISNIVSINQVEEDRKFVFDEPMSVALPVCIGRVPAGKEMVVKQLQPSNYWKELPSADVQFEDYREAKFVEGRCLSFGSFVVVLRPKKDKLQFTKKGSKLFCSFDTRITFTSKPGTFKQSVSAILEVQTLDGNVVPDLKSRAPVECEYLLTSSPFMKLMLPVRKLEKPLVVTLPLPLAQTRQRRPATGISRETKSQDIRPATARPSAGPSEDDAAESIYFLYRDDKTGWTVNNGVQLVQHKNKDVATFEITESYERIVLLRAKSGKRDSAIEKMATLLEKMSTQRNAKIILRQRHDDVSDVTIACTTSNKVDRALKNLEDNGFTEGPNPSSDLVLREGQELYLKFRGNIERVDSKSVVTCIYNTNIRATREFKVNEIDEFAQKSLPSYRGFVQVYTKAIVPKPIPDGASKNTPPEMVEAEVLLAELLVELPKPEAEPPKPLTTAPLHLKEGPLTNGFLRQIAGMLGKEWKDIAAQLNVKPMRIQAILRNHVNKDTPDARFDMLVTWAKRVPKAVDKVQILSTALVTCGRQDLAEEVRQRGQKYKQQRFMNARVSHLKQAFVKVAKCTAVFNRWKEFAKDIGVPEEKINAIEATGGSGQEKCFSSLESWKDSLGEEATINSLSAHLRTAKQDRLSRDVESVVAM